MEHDNQQPETPQDPTNGETLAEDSPRIWVGSLSDYNNGILHGAWLDAARSAEEIQTDIQRLLAASPNTAASGEVAEEWGIFDCDGFGPWKVGEHETISFVTAVARGIAEHGPAFAAWADLRGDEESLDGFADAYLGDYDSIDAYADQLIEDLGYNQLLDETLPEHVRRYVDVNVAGLAQDMWLSGDISVCHRDGGGVWLFDGRA